MNTAVSTAPAGPGFRHHLQWWLAELARVFAGGSKARRAARLVVVKTPDGLSAYRSRRGGREALFENAGGIGQPLPRKARRELQRLQGGKGDIILRLQKPYVLENTLHLPRAARDVLAPVIANQLDQITPWREGEAAFGHQVLEGTGDGNTLAVRVIATSQQVISDTLAEVNALGIKPSMVDYDDGTDMTPGITLRDDSAEKQQKLAATIARVLVGVAIVTGAIGATGVVSLIGEHQTLRAAESEIARQQGVLSQLAKRTLVDRQLAAKLGGVIKRKTQQPAVTITLAALSLHLPDTAWLTDVEISGDKVVIKGEAADAAELIGRLESLSHFKDVRFTAATTRSEGTNRESFAITAIATPRLSVEASK